MKRKGVVILLLSFIFISVLIFTIFPKTGFAVKSIDAFHLENLRALAQVECLQNSQCLNDSECVNNVCVEKKEINPCKTVSLSTNPTPLRIGESINTAKKGLTREDLPYLLSDGELVEIVDNKSIEYFYSPILLIGNNKIEEENQDYLIKNNEPQYTYKLTFSKPVDFSNKNIQGQTLRILGNEYLISSNSDNSNIYLVSDKKNIKLQEEQDIKIIKDENGKIFEIEITFPQNNLKVNENFTELTFNTIKLSFNSVSNGIADLKIGGNC